MIGSLSEQIAKWLNSKKIIEAEDVEVCGYGIFWLLNIIEFLLVSVILGTVLKVLPGALAFFISFLLLRLFGGGFHMDTELKCQITSLAIITAFIIAVKMTAVQKISFFMLLAAAAGTVVLFIFAPTGAGFEGGQIKAYRRICRLVCAASLFTSIVMFVFKVYAVVSGIAAGIIAEGLLCLAEILKEHRAVTKK